MTQRNKIIAAAISQLGIKPPESRRYMQEMFPYIAADAAWCAAFVSWCAEKAEVPGAVFPRHASCTVGREEWRRIGAWRERGYTPKSGDIIYFDWDRSGDCDHVGIVTDCTAGRIVTVEGNKNSAVRCGSYAMTDGNIAGFASPAYDERDNFAQNFAKQAVDWAVFSGVLLGDEKGDLKLTSYPTKEETALMLYRAVVKK